MALTSNTNAAGKRRLFLAGTLLVSWLAVSSGAFWWFTMKDLRPFAADVTLGEQAFDGRAATTSLETLLATHRKTASSEPAPRATILHFWDSSCACSRFNESHVQQLVARYRAEGIRLLVVDKQQLSGLSLQDAFGRGASPYRGMSLQQAGLSIPASPAAAVFDGEGRLAYFGPYSEGAACLAGNGDFVEQVLDKIIAGERPQQINISAFGCFCNWDNTERASA